MRFCEKSVAVAAVPCFDRPPHCSHSNILFANVVKPMVFATFFVNAEACR